jgi:hypothetical protein
VILQDDGTVQAFLGRDPQSGCTVKSEEDVMLGVVFLDPTTGLRLSGPKVESTPVAFRSFCSGALFLTTGVTTVTPFFGRADRGLDSFVVQVRGGKALVALDQLRLGACRVPVADDACSPPGSTLAASTLPPPAVGEWHVMGMQP